MPWSHPFDAGPILRKLQYCTFDLISGVGTSLKHVLNVYMVENHEITAHKVDTVNFDRQLSNVQTCTSSSHIAAQVLAC